MLEMTRLLLRGNQDENDRWKPGRFVVYIWQVPVMLLRFGIIIFLVGLMFLLWNRAQQTKDDLKVSLYRRRGVQ